jgi:hypothetical protein
LTEKSRDKRHAPPARLFTLLLAAAANAVVVVADVADFFQSQAGAQVDHFEAIVEFDHIQFSFQKFHGEIILMFHCRSFMKFWDGLAAAALATKNEFAYV